MLPRCYGTAAGPDGERALFLEDIAEAIRLDATGAAADWPPDAIDDAIRAAAGWHAAFWNLGEEAGAWAGRRPDTADMLADVALWRGLLAAARDRFPDLVSEGGWRRRATLLESLAGWHPVKDALPATLTHNDFNQRNVGFRPDVTVLDWELAARNIAQRDLVELLVFVLPMRAERAQIDRHIERHRAALVEAGVSDGVERDAWIEGFRCELKVEAINRIGYQFLFAQQYPLAYLARINAVAEQLLDFYA